MIETESLILDKAKFLDWKEMYHNVWSQPESARYMDWNLTTSEEAARIRIVKTIAFQKEHDTYLVYEKSSGFSLISSTTKTDSKDGHQYDLLRYKLKL